MNQRNAHTGDHDLVWLSGWVFADLLLGLFVIFLVSSRGGSPEELAAIPLPTPTFTSTATRTATPMSTWTPFPTLVPLPTYTPFPTLRPTVTAVPALSVGLDPSPYKITLRTDPALFLSGDNSSRRAAEDIYRKQLHACLDQAAGTRIGMAIASGYNQRDDNGQEMAKRSLSIMREEFRDISGSTQLFSEALVRDLHVISNDPYLNGMVIVEVFFLSDPRVNLPRSLLGTQCIPPPKTWCQGSESAQKLIVVNWDSFPTLDFIVDGQQTFRIKPANGTGNGDNRTVGCIMVQSGTHTWRAGAASGSLNVAIGMDPDPVYLCGIPARICPGGQLPTTGGPGTK